MEQAKKPIIILDANAFISSSHLLNLGISNRLVSTSQVLGELRDSKTRQTLNNLPFAIETTIVSKKSIQLVKEFAKKTGDIGSLSDVDLGIIALAYQFYLQEGLEGKLKKNPELNKEIINEIQEDDGSGCESDVSSEQEMHEKGVEEQTKEMASTNTEPAKQPESEKDDDGWIEVPTKSKKKEESSDQDMDEEEGWVTPQNYQERSSELDVLCKQTQDQEQIHVSLMSADYAVQNVATQMGIRLLSLDGKKIYSIRRFVWECYLCWKQFKVQENKVKLCSNCGYNSLSKVAFTRTVDGKMIMHRKKGWKPNLHVLQWKEKKFLEQEKKRKHQHPRKTKKASIFDTIG